MKYERRVSLSAVLPADDEDDRLWLGLILAPVGDLEQWNVNVTVGVPQ